MTNATKATWTDPTTNVDGSAISPGEITGYTLGVRDTSVAGSVAGTYPYAVSVPGAASTSALLSALTPSLPTGKILAASVRANTGQLDANNNPISSAWAAEVSFTLTPPPVVPNAPTGFGVA